MFSHHVRDLFLCTNIFELYLFQLTCFVNPIKVDAMSTMKMPKCWCTSLLDDLDNGLVVLQYDKTDQWWSARRSGLWFNMQWRAFV